MHSTLEALHLLVRVTDGLPCTLDPLGPSLGGAGLGVGQRSLQLRPLSWGDAFALSLD